ncbi:hypothetical protein MTR_3g080450 [Medicago truncatula]|uniref:Uncharacterized protein n=1 Tax=Medicago truncatula TaxID=3880 RepID=G7J7A5_MEDTR|nr:hypothetical protein MTR_3g080450 [Medicago truncatula]
MRLRWNLDTSEHEDDKSLSLFSSSGANNELYLFTMVVSGDFIYIRRHLRWDQKSMRESFSRHRKPEFRENCLLRFEVEVEGCKIKKCGWPVLHKEDYLEDLEVSNSENYAALSNSKHFSGMRKSRLDKLIEEIDAFDMQNIEKSNENLSLQLQYSLRRCKVLALKSRPHQAIKITPG